MCSAFPLLDAIRVRHRNCMKNQDLPRSWQCHLHTFWRPEVRKAVNNGMEEARRFTFYNVSGAGRVHPFRSLQIGLGATCIAIKCRAFAFFNKAYEAQRAVREAQARVPFCYWRSYQTKRCQEKHHWVRGFGPVSIWAAQCRQISPDIIRHHQTLRGCRSDGVVLCHSLSYWSPPRSARRLVRQCLLQVQPRIGTVSTSREDIVLLLTSSTIKWLYCNYPRTQYVARQWKSIHVTRFQRLTGSALWMFWACALIALIALTSNEIRSPDRLGRSFCQAEEL